MKTALFSHRKEVMPQTTLLPGKPELFSKLADRDIEAVVTLNGETSFDDMSVEAHELVDDYSTRSIGNRALADTGVIINRLDRSFKKDLMPSTWLDAQIPTINENELRSLAFRKHRMQEEVFKPLDLGIPTKLVDSMVDAAVFMEENPSLYYIAKPTSGTFSKGIEKLNKDAVLSYFSDESRLGSVILQPAYDFSAPFEAAIKPYDTESRTMFDTWAHSNATKEFRMYGFYTHGTVDAFPVARAMQDGQDNWFFVDPETVPDELYDATRKVLARTAFITGSKAIYGALDIAYGSQDPSQDPSYNIVEFNGRMPYMIGYDKHAGVADVLRDRFADQIHDTVYGVDKSNGNK